MIVRVRSTKQSAGSIYKDCANTIRKTSKLKINIVKKQEGNVREIYRRLLAEK